VSKNCYLVCVHKQFWKNVTKKKLTDLFMDGSLIQIIFGTDVIIEALLQIRSICYTL